MDSILSIHPQYVDMILTGKKPMEFRTRVIKDIVKGNKIYIYETKNKGGSGKVVGEAFIRDVRHTKEPETLLKLFEHFIDIFPQHKNDSPITSAEFRKYREEIGWSLGYAIHLTGIKKYETPLDLTEFTYPNGKTIERPPQGMCRCVKEGKL